MLNRLLGSITITVCIILLFLLISTFKPKEYVYPTQPFMVIKPPRIDTLYHLIYIIDENEDYILQVDTILNEPYNEDKHDLWFESYPKEE